MDSEKVSRAKEDVKSSPDILPASTETVSTIPADDAIPPVESPPQDRLGFIARQQAFEAQSARALRTEMGGEHTGDSHQPSGKVRRPVTKVIKVQEQSPKTVGHTKYDASKISLVAELKQTDSFGKPLAAIPSSTTGRYQSIAAEDESLLLISSKDEDEPSTGNIDEEKEKTSIMKALFEKRLQAAKDRKHQSAATSDQVTDPIKTTEGVKRDSLVASVNVVTKLMKWQMKSSRSRAGEKLQCMEKYKGHLEVIQRRSRQEQVDLPFPIRLSLRREALPIIHSVVREYELALGHDHKLTREALAKEKQLRAELTGDDVYL